MYLSVNTYLIAVGVLLMAIGKVDTDSGMPILTAIVFYGIGNGVAARNGNPSQPIIGSKNDQ